MAFLTGARGSYSTQIGQSRVAGPLGSGDLGKILVGGNANANVGGTGIDSPWQYLPNNPFALADNFTYSLDELSVIRNNTTDGNAEWYSVLTNSGTITMLSAQAGFSGLLLSTSGATNGNQNAFVACPGFLPVTNRISVMYGRFAFPAQSGHLSSIYFGFGNKQADPKGTQFTDGAWLEAVGSGTTAVFAGKTREASGTASTTTLSGFKTLAAGAITSIELAVVMIGQTRVEFWTRDPSTATNTWTKDTYSSTELPAATVVMRPHFVHYGDSGSAAQAVRFASPFYWFEKAATY